MRVTARIPCIVPAQKFNLGYMSAKKTRMSHWLDPQAPLDGQCVPLLTTVVVSHALCRACARVVVLCDSVCERCAANLGVPGAALLAASSRPLTRLQCVSGNCLAGPSRQPC